MARVTALPLLLLVLAILASDFAVVSLNIDRKHIDSDEPSAQRALQAGDRRSSSRHVYRRVPPQGGAAGAKSPRPPPISPADMATQALDTQPAVSSAGNRPDLLATCPQLRNHPLLHGRQARLFEVKIRPSYWLALYPPGEVVSDFTVKDGSWDLELISALSPHLIQYPGQVIVNAGGNIGTLAVYYAKAGFEVFAMEPHPLNFMMMNCSAQLNNVLGPKQLHLYQTALGDQENGKLCLTNIKRSNMGAMGVNPREAGCPHEVPSISLNAFVRKQADDFRNRFLLLLLDLEAYEPVVLNNMQSILADKELRPRFIVLETGCDRWKFINRLETCTSVTDLVFKNGYVAIWPPAAVENFKEYLTNNKQPRSRDDNVLFAIHDA